MLYTTFSTVSLLLMKLIFHTFQYQPIILWDSSRRLKWLAHPYSSIIKVQIWLFWLIYCKVWNIKKLVAADHLIQGINMCKFHVVIQILTKF